MDCYTRLPTFLPFPFSSYCIPCPFPFVPFHFFLPSPFPSLIPSFPFPPVPFPFSTLFFPTLSRFCLSSPSISLQQLGYRPIGMLHAVAARRCLGFSVLVNKFVPMPRRSKQPGCSRNVATAMNEKKQQGMMRFTT